MTSRRRFDLIMTLPLRRVPAGLVSCHSRQFVKSLQLTRRSGTRRWNLRVPDLQVSCCDLTSGQGTSIVVPAIAVRVTSPISICLCQKDQKHTAYLNLSLYQGGCDINILLGWFDLGCLIISYVHSWNNFFWSLNLCYWVEISFYFLILLWFWW